MVKQQEKTFSSNNNELSYSNNRFNSKHYPNPENSIHLPDNIIKNNIPFIPKAYNFSQNYNKNGNAISNNKIPEGDLFQNNMNINMTSTNTNNINNRKGSIGGESYSTCDEMSPVKTKKTKKQKKTFPKKDKKKKSNKSPFKGEAKDFKFQNKIQN